MSLYSNYCPLQKTKTNPQTSFPPRPRLTATVSRGLNKNTLEGSLTATSDQNNSSCYLASIYDLFSHRILPCVQYQLWFSICGTDLECNQKQLAASTRVMPPLPHWPIFPGGLAPWHARSIAKQDLIILPKKPTWHLLALLKARQRGWSFQLSPNLMSSYPITKVWWVFSKRDSPSHSGKQALAISSGASLTS